MHRRTQWLVLLLGHVRDVCTATPLPTAAPAARGVLARLMGITTSARVEPLDQWEVVGDYYAPAPPPVRSSEPPATPTASPARAAPQPSATAVGGVAVRSSPPHEVGAAATPAADAAPVPTEGTDPPTTPPTRPAPLPVAAGPWMRLATRTAVRVLQATADLARNPERASTLRARLRDAGALEALLDTIEVRPVPRRLLPKDAP
jgi:hypothetical protein